MRHVLHAFAVVFLCLQAAGASAVHPASATGPITPRQAALSDDPLIYVARGTLYRRTLVGPAAALLPPGSGVLDTGDAAPVLAPDRYLVLYGTRRANDRSGSWTDLWALDTRGGRPAHLVGLAGTAIGSAFAWSADSTGIVYAVFDEQRPASYHGPLYS